MEKILNFNEPLDVNLIDAVVGAFYGINAAEVCNFFLFSILCKWKLISTSESNSSEGAYTISRAP